MNYPRLDPRTSLAPSDLSTIPKKAPFKAKGHDRQLEDAQYGKFEVEVLPLNADTPYIGKIVRRDKYTITVDDGSGVDNLIYKHAIESIRIDRTKIRD